MKVELVEERAGNCWKGKRYTLLKAILLSKSLVSRDKQKSKEVVVHDAITERQLMSFFPQDGYPTTDIAQSSTSSVT